MQTKSTKTQPLATRKPASVRLESVGGDDIVASAAGAFVGPDLDAIARRFDRLIASTRRLLRVDCRLVTEIDGDGLDLFDSVAAMLHDNGAELVLIDLDVSVAVSERTAS